MLENSLRLYKYLISKNVDFFSLTIIHSIDCHDPFSLSSDDFATAFSLTKEIYLKCGVNDLDFVSRYVIDNYNTLVDLSLHECIRRVEVMYESI